MVYALHWLSPLFKPMCIQHRLIRLAQFGLCHFKGQGVLLQNLPSPWIEPACAIEAQSFCKASSAWHTNYTGSLLDLAIFEAVVY